MASPAAQKPGGCQGRGQGRAMRVLVVEDHAKLALAIAAVLRREGMATDVAFDGSDALEKTAASRYDVIVLDRDLPGVHGDQVCRELAVGGSAGILMLTASATIEERTGRWSWPPAPGCWRSSTSWPATGAGTG